MQLRGRRFEPATEPPRLTLGKTVVYAAAILLFLGIWKLLDSGAVRSPFAPTPTPTRRAESFVEEGKSFFDAGILDKATTAYQDAVAVDPSNPQLWAELARIQTYSSELMLHPDKKRERLQEARDSSKRALDLDDAYPLGWAIRTLVLDWSATVAEDTNGMEDLLNEALQASAKALLLEPDNPFALAFRAEVLVDQQNWSSALDVGARAAQLGPEIMDVHRAFAYVLESNGYYTRAIEEYLEAIRLNPNLPFLYLRLGAQYRAIGEKTTDPNLRDGMISDALEAFAHAALLNPYDPLPYLTIAQTYSNQGEFFIAEENARKALQLDNTNAYIYGRLGIIYYKAKNYETAIKVLRCSVSGCLAADNEEAGVDVTGEALSARNVDIYYTYGSVLSFYGDEDDNCGEAARIFAMLRESPYHDETVESIIREGEVICAAIARRTPTP
jgi:tetratricopeptide (TPR) repeat protein